MIGASAGIARAKRQAASAQTQRWHEDGRDSGFEVQ